MGATKKARTGRRTEADIRGRAVFADLVVGERRGRGDRAVAVARRRRDHLRAAREGSHGPHVGADIVARVERGVRCVKRALSCVICVQGYH